MGDDHATAREVSRKSDGHVRVLFLENDDSFTWNVVESLPVDRKCIRVRAGCEVAGAPPAIEAADVIIVGPGPTDPVRAGIVKVVLIAAYLRRPLLGICLGHQALGLAYGAKLIRVPPVHGKQTKIAFAPSRLFPSFTGTELVMRYNSLALMDVGAPLRVVAQTEDGIPMAIEHETLPMAGLQFHPDSFGSPRGKEMIADFFRAVT
jgi:anthranilate synthase/aminodeoxychorismate synthase-like glutamine amidotransferase